MLKVLSLVLWCFEQVDVEAQSLVGGRNITASVDVLRELLKTHHNATFYDGAMGVAQFIGNKFNISCKSIDFYFIVVAVNPDSGEMEAVSDPRKGGAPSAVL